MRGIFSDEEIISNLKRDFDRAVRGIISLMPEDAQSILKSFYDCESKNNTDRWRTIAALQVIHLAKPLPNGVSHSRDRAYCPLCGGGTTPPSDEGFAIPEGLRRHLIGWGDRQTQCFVFNAVELGARSHWSDKFHDQKQTRLAELEERRKSETLFKVDPDEPAKLIDEGFSWSKPRNNDELIWAENRLATLGFETHVEKNVRSYTSKPDHFVVYADPRANGRIEFKVYLNGRSASGPAYSWFTLTDYWENDILRKYEIRLRDALECD